MSGTRRAPRSSPTNTAIASSPWVVVSIGVVVMVVLLVVALGAYRGRHPDGGPRPDPAPPMVLPEYSPSVDADAPTGVPTVAPTGPVRPGLSPRSTVLPSTAPTVVPTPSPPVSGGAAGTPSVRPAAPVPPPAVTGRYRVVDSFHGGFIGEVLISNTARTDRGWTAALSFPGGRVVTAWVEGAPQGTLTTTRDGFTYRSGVDVAAGGSVPLRFHLEQADSRPARCTVDGVACR
ncbi:cellulose binding domain-containing protein [Micromonospora endolithica]|uniref:Cellulose-binding protein n=1 Tax=Micromonospora endolithica TaxID=230091 RepID=A0A3A9ZRN8_9ACTN|nr:cellulose binding domain-containing protein [Micromonospora endolithica]RKN50614.1 cellulose-binding protein [Micromonospora endolithica]TWJ20662.1 cellulose binding domain-containing protein [Micromonospora endolithica]